MNGGRKRIRLGGNCGELDRTKLRAFFLVVLVVVSIGSLLIISARAQGINTNQSVDAKVSHSPIHITNNSEFTAANGVSGGSGTPSDPYIIENWEIDANGGTYCISIENTDVYFVIRNCTVKNATFQQSIASSGIFLSNVQHATIKDNLVEENMNGIFLYCSSDISILNNTVFNNLPFGIVLYSSTMNNISTNNVSFSPMGIVLILSQVNSLGNNSMLSSGVILMGTSILDWTTNEVDITNTVNGLPIYFYKNQNGITVPTDAGQVILANCTNFVLSGLSFSNVSSGIQLAYSAYNTITASSFTGTQFGILAMFSEHTNITFNTITGNGYGISLEYGSNYTTITNNEISNNYRGIYSYISNNNVVHNNSAFGNNYSFLFWVSENNTISENNVFNNTHGIYLYFSSHNNTLRNNTICDNEYEGVFMQSANNNQLIGNKMWNCGIIMAGYELENWNTHEIDITNTVNGKPVGYYKNQKGGTIQSNIGQLILANCTNMTASGLELSNASAGIQLGFSSYNIINENTLTGHSCHGLYLWYSDHNYITNNSIAGNYQGIYFRTANSNSIIDNNVSGNTYGIYLYNSCKNEIKNNWLCANKEYGVFLTDYSSSNYLLHNYFVGNGESSLASVTTLRGVSGKCQAYDNSEWNTWYDNTTKEGNYWSNWDGNGWGTPDAYQIDGGKASDWYPLGNPVNEFPACSFLLVFHGIIIIVYRVFRTCGSLPLSKTASKPDWI
ncbi:MAG: NosD domain-containing protein [Thermoplasmata archaeon]